MPDTHPILLYDGVCGLCNRLVQFVIKRDRKGHFEFASLQSEIAGAVLKKHGRDPQDLDTVYVVVDYKLPSERLLARSDAILFVLKKLGGFWQLAVAGKVLPRPVRDLVYNLVARNRYRVFGKYESCMVPEPQHRAKFLDQQSN